MSRNRSVKLLATAAAALLEFAAPPAANRGDHQQSAAPGSGSGNTRPHDFAADYRDMNDRHTVDTPIIGDTPLTIPVFDAETDAPTKADFARVGFSSEQYRSHGANWLLH